jgi:hypothetical protein
MCDNIVIDPQFSVYRLVERVQTQSTLLNHRRAMSVVSYEIENATLLDGARTRMFSGFQYLSKFTPQIERYRKLAASSEAIYVFGVPDVTPPQIPNITYVHLKPTDLLSREWFLVCYGRDYFSTLATEELSQSSDPDDKRIFKGIWTFDLPMVSILKDWLGSAVDAKPLEYAHGPHNFLRHIQLLSNTMSRMMTRLMRTTLKAASDGTGNMPEQTKAHVQEVQKAIDTVIQPALEDKKDQSDQG